MTRIHGFLLCQYLHFASESLPAVGAMRQLLCHSCAPRWTCVKFGIPANPAAGAAAIPEPRAEYPTGGSDIRSPSPAGNQRAGAADRELVGWAPGTLTGLGYCSGSNAGPEACARLFRFSLRQAQDCPRPTTETPNNSEREELVAEIRSTGWPT